MPTYFQSWEKSLCVCDCFNLGEHKITTIKEGDLESFSKLEKFRICKFLVW